MYDVWMIQDLQPEDDSSHDMTPDTVHRLLVLVLAVTLGPGREILLVARRQPVAGGAVARGAADRLRSAGPRRCQQPGATAHSRGAAAAYYLKVGHARPRPGHCPLVGQLVGCRCRPADAQNGEMSRAGGGRERELSITLVSSGTNWC